MDSSIVASGTQSVLGDNYNMLLEVNKRLRQVQAGIYRASLKWMMLAGSLETSDRPEYWANPSGRDTRSVPPEMKGWDFGIRTDDLVGSREIVRTVLKALGDLKKGLENIQHRLRLNINKLSRPGLRSYNILDMPEEILYCIFEFVEGFLRDFPEFECGASRDIKNCRLTCQAFNRVSERFFLRSVSVDLNASSLSRFNDISNHPTISKSIQSIRAILHFYDTTLGDSLQDFILYNAGALYDRAETLELMAPWELRETISKETGMKVVEALKEASACWERIAWDTQAQSLADHDRTHLELLKTTHQRYQSLCAYQEEMLESGGFFASSSCGNIEDALCKDNVLPRLGLCNFDATAMKYGFTPRLCDMITKLPVAVHHAGAWLERIDIKLSQVESPSDLIPSPELRQQLPLAMQRLRKFTIRCQGNINGELSQDALYDMFGSCLDTGSLREISIDMSQMREPDKLGVGKIITSRRWQNLSYLFLRDVAFHFSELQLFVSRAPKSFSYFWVESVYLLSGTWAEVLDTLREKPLIDRVQLEKPLGAECADMSAEELKRIFDREDLFFRSQAERYIARLIPHNSLRDQERLDHDAVDVESED
ncbi:unnamed protein product [Clonostachys rhizophaga]|uniref:F-box domain-containing protein n=1 Tax=Clonostachys rhizophaga TaxID=160324 RepID=A0A9N9VAG8_9HYPO|nr:unnamed protein product [Clonostachys rhizophaga]